VPPLVRRESIRRYANLRGHDWLELIVRHLEESEKLSNQHADVALVDQSKTQIERPPPDTDIRVAQAVENGISVALYSIRLDSHHLDEGVERNIADVVVLVGQELAQNVDAEHAQP
jgi:hypothetical protein